MSTAQETPKDKPTFRTTTNPLPAADPNRPDLTQRVGPTFMVGVYLAVNAIRDVYLLVEGPDCVYMKTQFVQGNHDWLSTLTSVSGYHRVANTALHPVEMTESREQELREFLTRMAEPDSITGILLTSMPMAFITGTDYEGLCQEIAQATGKHFVNVKGKSLMGDWIDGYDETLYSLARQLDLSGGEADPNKVAIVGNLYDRNEGDHKGNVRELRTLVEGLGLELTSIWLDGSDFTDLFGVKDAGVVISLPYGRRAGKWIKRQTGAKLLEMDLPMGLAASERFVRQLAEATGREEQAEEFLNEKLFEVVPSLEWAIPFFFQDTRWGFVGDPIMAVQVNEVAQMVGATLAFAVITNRPHHVKRLKDKLDEETELLVYPRQRTMSEFVKTQMEKGSVKLVISHSEGTQGGDVATLELGFPSFNIHHFYDRPYLGFGGVLSMIDSIIQAWRTHERYQQQMRWMRRGDPDGPGGDRGPGDHGGRGPDSGPEPFEPPGPPGPADMKSDGPDA